MSENMVERLPEVGDILLFCIDNIEGRRRYRPFLVCSVVDGDSVSGEVFADYERDKSTAWALKIFYRLDKDTRTQWVSGILPGDGVGTWRFKEQQQEQVLQQMQLKLRKAPLKLRPMTLAQAKGLPR